MATPPTPNKHEATHCGWASIILGAVPLLMAAPVLQLTVFVANMNAGNAFNPATGGDWIIAVGAYVTAFLFLVLPLAGLRFGWRGFRAGYRTGESVVLCEVGIYLSLTAVLLWVGVAYALHAQAYLIFDRPRHAAISPQRKQGSPLLTSPLLALRANELSLTSPA